MSNVISDFVMMTIMVAMKVMVRLNCGVGATGDCEGNIGVGTVDGKAHVDVGVSVGINGEW